MGLGNVVLGNDFVVAAKPASSQDPRFLGPGKFCGNDFSVAVKSPPSQDQLFLGLERGFLVVAELAGAPPTRPWTKTVRRPAAKAMMTTSATANHAHWDDV